MWVGREGSGPAACFVTGTRLPDELSGGSAEPSTFSRGEGCAWNGFAIIIQRQQAHSTINMCLSPMHLLGVDEIILCSFDAVFLIVNDESHMWATG